MEKIVLYSVQYEFSVGVYVEPRQVDNYKELFTKMKYYHCDDFANDEKRE